MLKIFAFSLHHQLSVVAQQKVKFEVGVLMSYLKLESEISINNNKSTEDLQINKPKAIQEMKITRKLNLRFLSLQPPKDLCHT